MQLDSSPEQTYDVIFIGGGITGLGAAWQLARAAGPPLRLLLLEASGRWGGKIDSGRFPGPHGGADFIADAGPESFITRKPEAWELAGALGLQDGLVDPGGETRHMYLLDGGQIKAVPLSPFKFIGSDLLSWPGKLRLLAEPFVPARTDDADESLADFATRRLGPEAATRMIGPILAGIYNTDPEQQSILTTSPVMREMEREHGGLFRGALARLRARRKERRAHPEKARPSFVTFRDGAEVLVERLAAALQGAPGCELRLDTPARRVEAAGDGYRVELPGGETAAAAALVLAAPANVSAGLLGGLAPEAAAGLRRIDHKHIGTISLAYPAEAVRTAFPINGLMVPRRAQRRIDAVTFTSNKMPWRAPQGYALLRVFFGGADPGMVELPETALRTAVLAELKDLFGFTAVPLDDYLVRWPLGFPQAAVGHLDLVDEIEAALPPGVFTAGSSYRGIGVPDCIRQGQRAADAARAYLLTLQRLNAETLHPHPTPF